jgi:hypothetical protein
MSGTAYLGPMQSIFKIVQQVLTPNIKLDGNELDSIGNKTGRRPCIISPLHTFRGNGHVVTELEQARLGATQEVKWWPCTVHFLSQQQTHSTQMEIDFVDEICLPTLSRRKKREKKKKKVGE